MAVKDIIDKEIVDLDMDVNNKDEAILHLSSKLADAGYITDIEEFVADIYLRESEGITGIGNHIAIPHGKSYSVENVGIAIGRCRKPINWETIDEEPVMFIFLFAVPYDHNHGNNHLRLLAELAGKLGNDKAVAKLQSVNTFENLVEIFE